MSSGPSSRRQSITMLLFTVLPFAFFVFSIAGEYLATTLLAGLVILVATPMLFARRASYRDAFLIPFCAAPWLGIGYLRAHDGTFAEIVLMVFAALGFLLIACLVHLFWGANQDDREALEERNSGGPS